MAKILLFGQARFGEKVLLGLLDKGHTITAVCMPPAREGGAPDPMAAAAEKAGLRLLQRRSYKGEEAHREVAPEGADLAVLAYVTQIIPLAILDAPRLASICFHPSLLPAYRGGSAINWQLIAGETVGGVSLFRPDDGVDTGPVYLTRRIEIGPDDSAGSYYYAKVFDAGVAATLDAVELVLSGKAVPQVQDEALASHQPLCRDEHAGIDWSRPTARLHDLVRGCDPSPGAHCRLGEQAVRLYGSRKSTTGGRGEPGTVLALGPEGIEVATGDGALVLAKLAVGGAKKAAAAEAAVAAGISVGSRLENAAGGA